MGKYLDELNEKLAGAQKSIDELVNKQKGLGLGAELERLDQEICVKEFQRDQIKKEIDEINNPKLNLKIVDDMSKQGSSSISPIVSESPFQIEFPLGVGGQQAPTGFDAAPAEYTPAPVDTDVDMDGEPIPGTTRPKWIKPAAIGGALIIAGAITWNALKPDNTAETVTSSPPKSAVTETKQELNQPAPASKQPAFTKPVPTHLRVGGPGVQVGGSLDIKIGLGGGVKANAITVTMSTGDKVDLFRTTDEKDVEGRADYDWWKGQWIPKAKGEGIAVNFAIELPDGTTQTAVKTGIVAY